MQKPLLSNVIFSGVPAIRTTISDLKKLDIHGHLATILPQIERTFVEISPRTLNIINTSHIFKKHVEEFLKFPSKDTSNQVGLLQSRVEQDYNHRILTAKRHDTKTKRIREKGQVMTFYKTNKENLKLIFDLHNLFLKSQEILSNV